MNEPRRYDEQEVAEILRRATETDAAGMPLASGTGLTLAQIQQVGSEVGIAPARIASA